MKKSFLFVFLSLLSISLFAQNNRSTLRLRLSDGAPLKVAINSRNFDKIGTSLIIGDIPGRRPRITVYRFKPYADGRGGKAELVYSGKIKIDRGSSYDAIVDVRNNRLRLREVNSFANVPMNAPPKTPQPQILQDNQNQVQSNVEELSVEEPKNEVLSPQLQTIHDAMGKVSTDKEKLEVAQRYIGDKITTSDLVQILDWFFFDDTKLTFIKSAYPKISDKNNAAKLSDVFISESSKKELNQFLKK